MNKENSGRVWVVIGPIVLAVALAFFAATAGGWSGLSLQRNADIHELQQDQSRTRERLAAIETELRQVRMDVQAIRQHLHVP